MDCWNKLEEIFAKGGRWPACESCKNEMQPGESNCELICPKCGDRKAIWSLLFAKKPPMHMQRRSFF